ncbi:MAG: hypothetical protein LBT08_10170 [Synergistaceae bacterium]|nr:hypothetical protein [Synergistaceae bacterium]
MTGKLKRIAVYGKGGTGESTTTPNLSAALSELMRGGGNYGARRRLPH